MQSYTPIVFCGSLLGLCYDAAGQVTLGIPSQALQRQKARGCFDASDILLVCSRPIVMLLLSSHSFGLYLYRSSIDGVGASYACTHVWYELIPVITHSTYVAMPGRTGSGRHYDGCASSVHWL